ncbi:CGNR zinc finger domain-containing protein [Streptomyces halstedii]|uniref:CGNR zinc finger domain-containing protein n=1 Tax=Streptomyces halstedii TaxID=1944 RepID=UPI00345F4DAE
MERWPAVELVNTIRHDGSGGVADDLATTYATDRWIRDRAELLDGRVPAGPVVADEAFRRQLAELRDAVRALFAHTVGAPPSRPAEAGPAAPGRAVALLNAYAAREPVVPLLSWPPGEVPTAGWSSAEDDPAVRLLAALARASVDFLTGPGRERLRACGAPRCVRYFVRSHGRQEWCKPSCGNRARVARHSRRRRAGSGDGTGTGTGARAAGPDTPG